jgi:hypothetical protein
MPPLGKIDFSLFRDVVQGDIVRVLEPNTAATADEITTGRRIIEKAWSKED